MPHVGLWFERMSCAFAIFMIPYMALLELLHVLPRYHAVGDFTHSLHLVAGLFLLVNVSGNLYRLIAIDASTRGRLVNSNEVTPAWRFCTGCECHSPPRSYHCETCNICILKRDHHCIFAGNCVGLANQRHYLLTVAYFAIAGTYAALFNFGFVLEAHGGLSPTAGFQLMLPFVALCLGVSSLYQFCLAFTQAVCLMGGGLLWALLVFHLRLVLANQTTHERARRICDYDLGDWRVNAAQVMGPRMWLACVWPFATSLPTVDGYSFPVSGGRASSDGPRKLM